ncbi:hypothetical protein [Stutzerimonas nitrititolerans]|uniref:hypothetical protein n=1 Tax=Stutzerimonas nitrititolerans TaxID=2482751 RepID=UPI0007184301|nr:hypothetical protein [Stutzerimonas nitrititolerans]KRW68746.1 hypothetical protein AO735_19005 [Pseudomonas sp. TTU2014-096BSC]
MQNLLKIYIDSCAINILFKHQVNLAVEFPEEIYEIVITKGVRQEIYDIPEDKSVKAYALSLIGEQYINEASFFGFGDIENSENNLRYIGGFDAGSFATDEQLKFLEETQKNLGPPRRSKLRKNETDRDLLALGLGSIVITAENKVGGALKTEAEKCGTIIINIAKWPHDEISLNDYVELETKQSIAANI